MDRVILLLFAIPVVSIVFIGVYQVFDEMFKKKFVLERRANRSNDPNGAQRRRYSDSVPPGTLRNPEGAAASTPAPEVSVPQAHGV